MPELFRDAVGTEHKIVTGDAARIVSLVPSITELLFDLDLGAQVVGRTQFCVHPAEKVDNVPTVGGTKKINLVKFRDLKPTHVILNIDENTKEIAADLRKLVPNLIVTHPLVPRDNLDLYRLIGTIFGRLPKAESLCTEFETTFRSVSTFAPRLPERRVLYMIWKDPWMTVSRNTYIARMLDLVRWRSVMDDPKMRYPKPDMARVLKDADLVLLSSEPYAFTDDDVAAFKQSYDTKGKIVRTIDGAMVSWYGSRAIQGLKYLRQTAAETK
ncbi:MAG: cobalamin-binding protein [Alphaproteobacteria bacterium]|nr:cobalamin-binding protein [Alphaproteobacteria bacterium]